MSTRNSRTITKQLIKGALGTSSNPQKRWRQRADGWGKSEALLNICSPFQKQRSFVFTCSDDEGYDVLSVIDGRDALLLLAAGVRSADEAREFLSRHGLDHLIEDNSALAREASLRGLVPHRVFTASSDLNRFRHDLRFIDAVDAGSQESVRSMNHNDPYAVSLEILGGTIDYFQMQSLGLNRIAKASYGGNYETMMDYLRNLASGKLSYGPIVMARTMRLAERKSVDGIEALRLLDKYGFQKMKTVVEYCLAVKKLAGDTTIIGELSDVYDAGVDIPTAAIGIKGGLTCGQIVAIDDGTVHPAVANGWL